MRRGFLLCRFVAPLMLTLRAMARELLALRGGGLVAGAVEADASLRAYGSLLHR